MASQNNKVLSPNKLAHIVLRTSAENYKAMVNFYKTFLGGMIQYQNAHMSFITYDDEHHRIAIIGLPNVKPKDRDTCGLEHVAFTFDSLKTLLLAYKQRKELGIKPLWSVNHGPTFSMYYADPDGNQIETQVDSFESPEEANEFMSSEAFDVNPVGADFDPEEILKRLENGVPESDILKRQDVGPRSITTIPLLTV